MTGVGGRGGARPGPGQGPRWHGGHSPPWLDGGRSSWTLLDAAAPVCLDFRDGRAWTWASGSVLGPGRQAARL